MIVNSHHPCKPTSQQQQRCVGLSPQPQHHQPTAEQAPSIMNQQNSLYGASMQQASHMFDLANLQQHINQDQQQHMIMMNQQQQHQQQQQQQQRRLQTNNASSVDTSSATQQDVSLYSPSSSTSLLYHIYDQINLPGELQHQTRQQHQQQDAKKSTTILNPASLFGGGQHQPQPLLPPAPPLPPAGQMSLQQLNDFQKQCYGSSAHYQHQFGAAASQQQQQQQQSYHDSGNLMLDVAMMRLAGTLAASRPGQQQLSRPLSSAGTTSSLSARSTGQIAYGRQPRQTLQKSSHLVNVLHQNSALGHHNHLHVNSLGRPSGKLPVPLMLAGNKWKRCGQRVRQAAYEYRTIVKCSSLLILLAFSLMSIIKFSLLQTTSASNNSPAQAASPTVYGSNIINPPPPSFSMAPSTKLLDPLFPVEATQTEQQDLDQAKALQKSRLVIGEFVIVNQNYSREQQTLLAGTIVNLMDQVFLAAPELRRYYSKMEVTNISPHKPSGIIVSCNILLNESITYAAQLFGIALYESLNKSHEHLANYRYIIDKSSIKFNTVTDKDLRTGNLPPTSLIAPSVRRLFNMPPPPAPDSPAPPAEMATDELLPPPPPPPFSSGQDHFELEPNDGSNQVIWSEWSPWSSCVDKNGFCDSSRLHSRIRKCYVQTTGQKVDVSQCKMRFNSQDQEIEVIDCQRTCQQQDQAAVLSDAPHLGGPHTAPPILVGPPLVSTSGDFQQLNNANNKPQKLPQQAPDADSPDGYTPSLSSSLAPEVVSSGQQAAAAASTAASVQSSSTAMNTNDIVTSSPATPLATPPLFQQQQQLACSNCTTDEICLLLIDAKVPFCAKIKDRQDESGCGGWCKAPAQLCHPAGANAFKCIHDTECLPEEWRCLDSGCIPLSKRCDGHSNCYDSSDERGCPVPL